MQIIRRAAARTRNAPRSAGAGFVAPIFLALAGCTLLAADAPWRDLAVVKDARIGEASGIVASRQHPGMYYVHNDSGDEARVFLVDEAGQTRAVISLTGAKNKDWEDIAIAPGAEPDRWDVCVADIGDNKAKRDSVCIYRFAEPSEIRDQCVQAQSFRFEYPDAASDAEGLFVHPATGNGYILTKHLDGACFVYRLTAPWNPQETQKLERVSPLHQPPLPGALIAVTGADLSPDGACLVTRGYAAGWRRCLPGPTADAREFENIFGVSPQQIQLAPEVQGEGICFTLAGTELITISEKRPTHLYAVPTGVAPLPSASQPASTAQGSR